MAVTAGYIGIEARREFYAKMDAANVDLKGFTDEFYVKLCGARLQPVLDTLVYLKHETDVWFEITTLLIPGKNDSDAEIEAMSRVDRARARHGRAAAFHRVPSRLQDDGHRAHAGGDAHAGARHRARRRAFATSTRATCTTAPAGRRPVPDCGKAVIVRDWHEILRYALTGRRSLPALRRADSRGDSRRSTGSGAGAACRCA